MPLTISQLAQSAEVGVETIRFYQRKGLLHDPKPGGGVGGSLGRGKGQKHYGQSDVRRLRFIRSAQAAGFILSEIAELLELDASDDRVRIREMAEVRLTHLDREIAQLERARQSLTRLTNECARGDAGPCPILEAFDEERKCGQEKNDACA